MHAFIFTVYFYAIVSMAVIDLLFSVDQRKMPVTFLMLLPMSLLWSAHFEKSSKFSFVIPIALNTLAILVYFIGDIYKGTALTVKPRTAFYIFDGFAALFLLHLVFNFNAIRQSESAWRDSAFYFALLIVILLASLIAIHLNNMCHTNSEPAGDSMTIDKKPPQ